MVFGSEPHGTSAFSANLAGAASFRWVEAARCPSGSIETKRRALSQDALFLQSTNHSSENISHT